jgi:hypothetical protein
MHWLKRWREQAAVCFAERKAAWLAKHGALKQERDALAEELPEVYSPATKIVDGFGRVDANNRALAELHRNPPDGMEQYLVSAE